MKTQERVYFLSKHSDCKLKLHVQIMQSIDWNQEIYICESEKVFSSYFLKLKANRYFRIRLILREASEVNIQHRASFDDHSGTCLFLIKVVMNLKSDQVCISQQGWGKFESRSVLLFETSLNYL